MQTSYNNLTMAEVTTSTSLTSPLSMQPQSPRLHPQQQKKGQHTPQNLNPWELQDHLMFNQRK